MPLPSFQEIIQSFSLKPQKKLGQNFILKSQHLDHIVSFAGDLSSKTVIEIGPGPGGLTHALLKAKALKVIVVEKDPACLPFLHKLQSYVGEERLQILLQDMLDTDVETLEFPRDTPPLLMGNLPYYICVPILLKVLKHSHLFSDIIFMFQKEVADRLMAKPHTKSYGRLSVMAQWKTSLEPLLTLEPHVFFPPPKILSTLVRLTPRPQPFNIQWKILEHVVQKAFHHRRKMLRASFEPALLEKSNIDPTERPENLTVPDFCNLARLCE